MITQDLCGVVLLLQGLCLARVEASARTLVVLRSRVELTVECEEHMHTRTYKSSAWWERESQYLVLTHRHPRQILFNPFCIAVPLWEQTTQIPTSLSLKRDCVFKRVDAVREGNRNSFPFYSSHGNGQDVGQAGALPSQDDLREKMCFSCCFSNSFFITFVLRPYITYLSMLYLTYCVPQRVTPSQYCCACRF